MNILQTIAGFGAKSGGTSTCTYDLLNAMHERGENVELLTPDVTHPLDHLMGRGESWIKALSYDCRTPYGISKNIKNFLKASDYDIYHTNGLWMYSNHITCSAAREKGRPYIITPHGMLYPQALHRSYWKKWPLLKLFFETDIHRAACIHVTCEQEMKYVRKFGYKGPIAVIPNPATIPDNVETLSGEIKRVFLGCNRPRKLGFLGRLHPRKKIENLLYGLQCLGEINADSVELIIMGKGDDRYEQFLRSEVNRLGLKNVTFMGFVSGQHKYELLSELSALFVPSDFENFGMIVTEALSVGTPVMASLGTPWEELNTYHCGWWMDRTSENIASVMRQVLEMPLEQLLEMGDNGKRLIKEHYVADLVAKRMWRLYEWMLKGGEKPEFVYE